ncbi:hypothetical protein LZ32DRAFT_161562 [Colletotrichum eremochloae]|nr:hypothetical protein LZ32DRAFT_161562 [Colletotrichum eremochloae]
MQGKQQGWGGLLSPFGETHVGCWSHHAARPRCQKRVRGPVSRKMAMSLRWNFLPSPSTGVSRLDPCSLNVARCRWSRGGLMSSRLFIFISFLCVPPAPLTPDTRLLLLCTPSPPRAHDFHSRRRLFVVLVALKLWRYTRNDAPEGGGSTVHSLIADFHHSLERDGGDLVTRAQCSLNKSRPLWARCMRPVSPSTDGLLGRVL